MKLRRLGPFLKLARSVVLFVACAAVIVLTLWEYWENQMMRPSEEQNVAVNHFVSGSKRDGIQLLLARQLGLTNQPPLSANEAKREFALAQQELRVSWQEESRHTQALGEFILGPKFKLKLALAYIVTFTVLFETYFKLKSAWLELREPKAAVA